jgi:hypothetical protein
MKYKFFTILTYLLFGTCLLSAADQKQPNRLEEPKIFVNNRVLAIINGKPITTYDLVRKMDMSFYKQYPEYVKSNQARFQFYQQGWKYILEDLIHEELVLADAKESKIEVSAGDVRQEIEQQFGPNIIENLDKAGMTLDEAFKVVQSELILQRTIGARVNVKAMRIVTPAKIKAYYDDYISKPENKRLTKWQYRVVTIKDRDIKKTEVLSKSVYQLLMDGIPLDQLAETLSSRKMLGRNGKVTVSNEVSNNEKELSETYKEVLANLDPGMFSQPFPFKSRTLKSTVYRIIYVKEIEVGTFPTFKELEPRIKQKLLNETADKETDLYLEKLRQHYHVREVDLKAMIPTDYQPFILK